MFSDMLFSLQFYKKLCGFTGLSSTVLFNLDIFCCHIVVCFKDFSTDLMIHSHVLYIYTYKTNGLVSKYSNSFIKAFSLFIKELFLVFCVNPRNEWQEFLKLTTIFVLLVTSNTSILG